jgi:hypothetical protein
MYGLRAGMLCRRTGLPVLLGLLRRSRNRPLLRVLLRRLLVMLRCGRSVMLRCGRSAMLRRRSVLRLGALPFLRACSFWPLRLLMLRLWPRLFRLAPLLFRMIFAFLPPLLLRISRSSGRQQQNHDCRTSDCHYFH